LDHADVIALEQMPAIANFTPGLVFGIFRGDHQKLFSLLLTTAIGKRPNLHLSGGGNVAHYKHHHKEGHDQVEEATLFHAVIV
jgi:hypothetical protein